MYLCDIDTFGEVNIYGIILKKILCFFFAGFQGPE